MPPSHPQVRSALSYEGRGELITHQASNASAEKTTELVTVDGPNGELEVNYEKNVTLLYESISNCEWEIAVQALKDNPEEAKTWVVRYHEDESSGIMWRFLPLHSACAREPPTALVSGLLGSFPEAADCSDDQGMYPLHYACGNHASAEVIRVLLIANPKAVNMGDPNGMLPIHYMTQWGASSTSALEAILFADPSVIDIEDAHGNTPIDYAMEAEDHPDKDEVIALLRRHERSYSRSEDDSHSSHSNHSNHSSHSNHSTGDRGEIQHSASNWNRQKRYADRPSTSSSQSFWEEQDQERAPAGTPVVSPAQQSSSAPSPLVRRRSAGTPRSQQKNQQKPSPLQQQNEDIWRKQHATGNNTTAPSRDRSSEQPVHETDISHALSTRSDSSTPGVVKSLAKLNAEIAKLRAEAAYVEAEMEETLQNQREDLQSQIDEMKTSVDQSENDVKNVKADIFAKVQYIEELEREIEGRENDIKETEEDNTKIAAELEQWSEVSEQHEELLAALQSRAKELSKSLKAMKEEQDEIIKNITAEEEDTRKTSQARKELLQAMFDEEMKYTLESATLKQINGSNGPSVLEALKEQRAKIETSDGILDEACS